jgi:hypothetical protein
MATAYCQIATEQTPNAEGGAATVSSNVFYLPGIEIPMDPGLEVLDIADELRGYAAEPPHLGAAAYAPKISGKIRARPSYLGLLLLLATSGTCTTTEGNGSSVTDPDSASIPATAYRHVFSWSTTDPPKTAQMQLSPPSGLFFKASGCGLDRLAFEFDKGCLMANPEFKALYWGTQSDPSLTPSMDTTAPFREGNMTISWMSNSAVTKDFGFAIDNNLETDRQFTTASLYPDRVRYTDTPQRITGTIAKETFDADDWAALIGGTTFSATIKLVHNSHIASTSYHHSMWIEMPACQLVKSDIDPIKNTRRHEAKYDWQARYDTATSKWATITLVNGTAAYETY